MKMFKFQKRPIGAEDDYDGSQDVIVYCFYDKTGQLLYVGYTRKFSNSIMANLYKKPWWSEVTKQRSYVVVGLDKAKELRTKFINKDKPKYQGRVGRPRKAA